jgi:hypothetical protein
MGILDGQAGDSVFLRPYISLSSTYEHNQTIPPLFRLIEKSGDDRSFTIVTATILESQLDKILQAIMPDYDEIEEDLTLDLKIGLLDVLKPIPSKIIRSATCIRKIRNVFAHEFELESLEKIGQQDKDRLISSYKEFNDEANLKSKPTRELFSRVAFFTIIGLSSYRLNVTMLREAIQSPKFVSNLEEESKKRDKEEIERITQKPPKEVEIKGGLRVERFEKGVTNVTSISETESTSNESSK